MKYPLACKSKKVFSIHTFATYLPVKMSFSMACLYFDISEVHLHRVTPSVSLQETLRGGHDGPSQCDQAAEEQQEERDHHGHVQPAERHHTLW